MNKTKLMGILNATPDSFFDKGRFYNLQNAIDRGIEIYREGADLIDIGGESTRPNATPVSLDEELERVIPLISALKNKIPIPISIDTMKNEVAKEAIKAGATFINDVSGFRDREMVKLAAKTGVTLCLMHMRGTPLTMQKNPDYEMGVIEEIRAFFQERVSFLLAQGVQKEQIILDPGIGFGKSIADNLKIIHNLNEFKSIGYPLLLGISRKSFMGKILNKEAVDLLPATLGLTTILLLSQIEMIRVHDVKEHRVVIDLLDFYEKTNV